MRIKRGICLSLCAFFICAAAGCGKEEESPEVFLSQEPSAGGNGMECCTDQCGHGCGCAEHGSR